MNRNIVSNVRYSERVITPPGASHVNTTTERKKGKLELELAHALHPLDAYPTRFFRQIAKVAIQEF